MSKRTIADVEVRGRRVLMRVDFNVPLADDWPSRSDDANRLEPSPTISPMLLEGQTLTAPVRVEPAARRIADDRRIRLAIDSIRNVMDRGGRLILMTHLGRPAGRGYETAYSMQACARRLSELLRTPVLLAPDCVGSRVRSMVEAMRDGEVLMLENLRFHEEEVLNKLDFAAELAAMGDVYCNEAFAASHRPHASLVALPGMMDRKPRVAGLQLCREARYLRQVASEPHRPFVLVLGGVRVADKLGPMLNLLDRLDAILVGGTVATTFMLAEGRQIGRSLADLEHLSDARTVLDAAGRHRARLMLPMDHVCAQEGTNATETRVFEDHLPEDWGAMDIGPRTMVRYSEYIRQARTIVWAGPMGVWEEPPFDVGTKMTALATVHATLMQGAQSIIAGTSTALAVERFGLQTSVTHVSVGGNATLALLEGKRLASVELLDDAGEGDVPEIRQPSVEVIKGVRVRTMDHG